MCFKLIQAILLESVTEFEGYAVVPSLQELLFDSIRVAIGKSGA